MERFTHTFEAGRRGKPDEIDWQIGQLLAAHCLSIDSSARCNIRVEGGYVRSDDRLGIIVRGEISEHLLARGTLFDEFKEIAIGHYNAINRTTLRPDDIEWYTKQLNPQSSALSSNARQEKSGDSGSGIGIAVRGTGLFLPFERHLAKDIANLIDDIYQADGVVPKYLGNADVERLEGLRADGKVEVMATYLGKDLHKVRGITIAANQEAALSVGELRSKLEPIVREYLHQFELRYPGMIVGTPRIVINGAGDWKDRGSWYTDAGTNDAKPHREWFGSWGVNEDSGSGEDPSKPSAPGTLLARFIAMQVVGSGMADVARALVKFEIGEKYPSFMEVNTYGTGKASQDDIERQVHAWIGERKIPHSLADAVDHFGLRNAARYREFARASDYFHFPAGEMPWNAVVVEKLFK